MKWFLRSGAASSMAGVSAVLEETSLEDLAKVVSKQPELAEGTFKKNLFEQGETSSRPMLLWGRGLPLVGDHRRRGRRDGAGLKRRTKEEEA